MPFSYFDHGIPSEIAELLRQSAKDSKLENDRNDDRVGESKKIQDSEVRLCPSSQFRTILEFLSTGFGHTLGAQLLQLLGSLRLDFFSFFSTDIHLDSVSFLGVK